MAGITVSDSDGWEEDVVAVFPGTGFLIDDFLGKKLNGRNLASVGTGGHGEKRVLDSHDNIVTEEKEKGKSPTKFPWGQWSFFDEKQRNEVLVFIKKAFLLKKRMSAPKNNFRHT